MMEMVDSFMFSAQSEPMKIIEELPNSIEEISTCKRARADGEDPGEIPRMRGNESFKSKLINSSHPGSWTRLGSGKENTKIEHGDIVFVESPRRTMIKLSSELKQQLCKTWTNVLILKIMGRPHTLNFTL
ncbi:hypothetical protein ACOSQ2_010598 [Xanthoceras sorbifolium]